MLHVLVGGVVGALVATGSTYLFLRLRGQEVTSSALLSAAAAGLIGGAVASATLGAGGAVDERPRLQSWAMEGLLEERCAAILALGELGPSASGILLPIAMDTWSAGRTDESRRIAECALLALLRSGFRLSMSDLKPLHSFLEFDLATSEL